MSRILRYVVNNPGCTISETSESLEMNRGTVKYHLRKLYDQNKITIDDSSKIPRFFQNNSMFSMEDKQLISILQEISHRHIVQAIMGNPGLTNSEISHLLNLSKSTVSWHMGILVSKGIMRVERDGKYKRYFVDSNIESDLIEILSSTFDRSAKK